MRLAVSGSYWVLSVAEPLRSNEKLVNVAVPSVLLYRVLTVWLPVFAGWPIMRWLTARDMI